MTRIIPAATLSARRTIRSGAAGVLATTALIATIACSGGSDSSTGPRNDENPVGTFALFQVGQKNIPRTIFRGPMTFPGGGTYDEFIFTITGGEMILQDNGDIHVAIDYKASADGDEVSGTRSADGTYEVEGNQIFAHVAVRETTETDSSEWVAHYYDPAYWQAPWTLNGKHTFTITTKDDPAFDPAGVHWLKPAPQDPASTSAVAN